MIPFRFGGLPCSSIIACPFPKTSPHRFFDYDTLLGHCLLPEKFPSGTFPLFPFGACTADPPPYRKVRSIPVIGELHKPQLVFFFSVSPLSPLETSALGPSLIGAVRSPFSSTFQIFLTPVRRRRRPAEGARCSAPEAFAPPTPPTSYRQLVPLPPRYPLPRAPSG